MLWKGKVCEHFTNSIYTSHATQGTNFAAMPQAIQKRREYDKKRSQNPGRKAAKKAYLQTDKGRAYQKAYRETDEAKAYHKAYNAALRARSRSRPKGHDLYIMKIPIHGNWYKVGCAADPHFRANDLSKGYPWQPNVVKVYDGCGKYEKMVHDKLRPFMISGENKKETEWFEISEDELIRQIEDILLVELF